MKMHYALCSKIQKYQISRGGRGMERLRSAIFEIKVEILK